MPSILLVKTSSLGDVIHNLPMVTDIAAQVPDAHIEWAVEEAFAPIPALHPRVNKIIPVALRRWRKQLGQRSTWEELARLRGELRAKRYDLVIDTQGLLKSAFIGMFADGPVAGQDRHSAREPLAAFLYQRVYDIPRTDHAVTRNRLLAARALQYSPSVTAPDYGLRVPPNPAVTADLPGRYAVCLHGTARDSKRWPLAHWISLARTMTSRGLAPIFSWGTLPEQESAQAIAAAVPGVIVPAGRLGLKELPAILDRATAVLGVDTGLMHLAVALNRPTVGIYVDTMPQLSGALPSDPRRAINLGGQGAPPAVEEVVGALERLAVL